LLLDEAYADFAPEEALLDPDVNGARVVHLRTFSKAHGMAGARIGYAIAPRALVEGLDKIRNHFGINRVALAGALASLGDVSYIDS
ncbi:MAG: aminotransferase class I/II-fold pyridoxal phosphate-dependent enzyme, partial [Candidatus Latescibacterota bacterium]